MNLPHPEETLAGCVWLPRLAAKIRSFSAGELPFSYRIAFGGRIGVDGYFLRHFQLSIAQMVVAVRTASDDEALANWFLQRPSVSMRAITEWNSQASKLGAPGQPGFLTLGIVKWFLYPKSRFRNAGSIFKAIELDEGLIQWSRE